MSNPLFPSDAATLPAHQPDSVLRVSELNRLARQTLEQRFPLGWISGEISNLTRAASGHIYFTLKDEAAQVRCAMFRNRAQLVPWRLENGMKVEARALVTLYEARGEFQLNVESLRLAGIGALYEAFARLRDRLAAEGLFAVERKRPLPPYPRAIGIVTSLQAAALRDVLAALRRRAPHVPVILYPTPVQGEGAAIQIAGAIGLAGSRAECDVLLLVRGGGSIEDLWSFNEEIVSRAIRACPIPVVCGVGHETDTTIADFSADRRAATPTAAAELVSAGYLEARQQLDALARQMRMQMRRGMDNRAQRLDTLSYRLLPPSERLARTRLHATHLGNRLLASMHHATETRRRHIGELARRLARSAPRMETQQAHLTQLADRLAKALQRKLKEAHQRSDALAQHLAHLNPAGVLSRGYSIVRNADGHILRSAAGLRAGDAVSLQFADGQANAHISNRD